MNINNVKELYFTRNQDGTFNGYIIAPVYDGKKYFDMKIKIDRARLSDSIENIEVLENNGNLLSFIQIKENL